jgi:hypothetical protein
MSSIAVTPSVVQDIVFKERFWATVQRCEHGELCHDCCWLWTGNFYRVGYGRFFAYKPGLPRAYGAHRISWELRHGPIPDDLCVCHNCPGGDNRACVNPQHLWLGTRGQNVRDASQKGSLQGFQAHMGPQRRGESCHLARLGESQVLDIRYLAAHGMPRRLLGTIYGVTTKGIDSIVRGKSWKHLPLIVEER